MNDPHYNGPVFNKNNYNNKDDWHHEDYSLPKTTKKLAQSSSMKGSQSSTLHPKSSLITHEINSKSKISDYEPYSFDAPIHHVAKEINYQKMITLFAKDDDQVYLFEGKNETTETVVSSEEIIKSTSQAVSTSIATSQAVSVDSEIDSSSQIARQVANTNPITNSNKSLASSLTKMQQAHWIKDQVRSKKVKKVRQPTFLQQSVHQALQNYHQEQDQIVFQDNKNNDDRQISESKQSFDNNQYHFPSLQLLAPPTNTDQAKMNAWAQKQTDILNETLSAFHVQAQVARYTIGPTVTQFEVSLARGVKVNKITNLNDDLKLALAARDIRIEAPIPGKNTVGIEIPNLESRTVMLSEVLRSPAFQNSKSPLTVALGVDLFGKPMIADIGDMPHGLIAGATGSGKSVFINSILVSLLYKALPSEVKLLLIDPKAVELAPYNGLPHLLAPVISDPKAAAEALKWTVNEMENRYQKLAAAGVRNIKQFNKQAKDNGDYGLVMPYIVIVIDELADLMMVASNEVQDYIARITQKARAAGIHLLVATQRPSVDVITGTIKNNIPTRIAFMVSSQVDSRTILDTAGAERLLGRGDMLYLGNGKGQPIRLQGTYVESEIDAVVDFVKQQLPPHYLFEPDSLLKAAANEESEDAIFGQVLEYIANEKQVSTSKLQRVFSIGYNRAANLIDELEKRHYVSAAHGSKPRDIYFTKDDLKQYQKNQIAHL